MANKLTASRHVDNLTKNLIQIMGHYNNKTPLGSEYYFFKKYLNIFKT